ELALVAVIDDAAHEIEIFVEEIDAPSSYRQPRAAVDPPAPLSQTRDVYCGIIVKLAGNPSDVLNVKRGIIVVIKAKVDIRIRLLHPRRPGTAQDNSSHTANLAEPFNEILHEIGRVHIPPSSSQVKGFRKVAKLDTLVQDGLLINDDDGD